MDFSTPHYKARWKPPTPGNWADRSQSHAAALSHCMVSRVSGLSKRFFSWTMASIFCSTPALQTWQNSVECDKYVVHRTFGSWCWQSTFCVAHTHYIPPTCKDWNIHGHVVIRNIARGLLRTSDHKLLLWEKTRPSTWKVNCSGVNAWRMETRNGEQWYHTTI